MKGQCTEKAQAPSQCQCAVIPGNPHMRECAWRETVHMTESGAVMQSASGTSVVPPDATLCPMGAGQ